MAKRRSMIFSCAELCLDATDVKEADGGESDVEAGLGPRTSRKDSTSVLQRHISFASDEGGGRAAGGGAHPESEV